MKKLHKIQQVKFEDDRLVLTVDGKIKNIPIIKNIRKAGTRI